MEEKVRLYADPPAGLVASITWDAGDGQVVLLNVCDEPGQAAAFDGERLAPASAELGQPMGTAAQHGEPLASIRG